MGIHGGHQGWSDLPGDLLSTIYLGFLSAYDRARFAAICTSWRAVAACHPRLPALPLLLPGDSLHDLQARAYCPEDGRSVSVPHPWVSKGNRLVGSYDGGWIATASHSKELLIVNLFSGARTALSAKQRFVVCACPSSFWGTEAAYVKKIIFSADPLSSSCILIAITRQCDLALCRVGSQESGWTTRRCGTSMYKELRDITFCKGELYGLTFHNELLKFHVGVERDGALVAHPVHLLDINISASHLDTIGRHIFELRGKLAIAVQFVPQRGQFKGTFFKVFELAGGEAIPKEVTSLGDHALFLGQASSKAVHVSVANQRGMVKGNHIYYMEHSFYRPNEVECLAGLDCTVCRWESKGTHPLERILSSGYHSYPDENSNIGCNSCIWLWPPDF